jgi:hypothetical protein
LQKWGRVFKRTGGQELEIRYFMHIQYPISVNVDEEIGRLGIWGRLRVADYRDGGGGYCTQSVMTEDKVDTEVNV